MEDMKGSIETFQNDTILFLYSFDLLWQSREVGCYLLYKDPY